MLKGLFSSAIRADVLSLLYNSPDNRFYVREIAKLLQKNPSGIKRELDNLENIGVLRSERVANLKYFSVDRSAPVFNELRGLISKSLGLMGSLEAVLRGSGVGRAFVYGAYADGKSTKVVDLMVVGAQTDLVRSFRDLERKFDCTITWLEMEERDYREKKKNKDAPMRSIFSSRKISIIGKA
jgi:hypothetical protein